MLFGGLLFCVFAFIRIKLLDLLKDVDNLRQGMLK